MTFLEQDFTTHVVALILASCHPHPTARFNGLAAASQDHHAHWRNFVVSAARMRYAQFNALHIRLTRQHEALFGGRRDFAGMVQRPIIHGPIEAAAIEALHDLAGLLCFDH